ncbi:MAG: ribosome maturation factor RimP [Eubacterium sp.]|nr:ribosome maturation factor RimP [Eubacterium sp.]
MVLPIVELAGLELWDVEYVKEGSDYYLRVYIDKSGGVNIDDCVLITKSLNEKLDADDFIEDAYILEVSSPGLTRKLKKDKEFEKSIGKLIRVKLYKAEEGSKEHIGRLKEFAPDKLTIEVDEADISLSRDNISCVRLEYEEVEE